MACSLNFQIQSKEENLGFISDGKLRNTDLI